VKFWFATCENRRTSSNLSSAHRFSFKPFASDAKSNYACFGEGLNSIGHSIDSVSVRA
jgi:hypothetical protein